MDCGHCGTDTHLRMADSSHGPEFDKAVKWFRKAMPAKKPFQLFPWKPIDDPESFWKRMAEDLASDNFYVRERMVDSMIALHKVFDTFEKDF